jgi:hypothetical protein
MVAMSGCRIGNMASDWGRRLDLVTEAVEGREVVHRYVVGRWVSADGRRSLGTMMGLTVCGGDAAGAASGTGAGGEAETTEQQ